jgi:hypothetical protein
VVAFVGTASVGAVAARLDHAVGEAKVVRHRAGVAAAAVECVVVRILAIAATASLDHPYRLGFVKWLAMVIVVVVVVAGFGEVQPALVMAAKRTASQAQGRRWLWGWAAWGPVFAIDWVRQEIWACTPSGADWLWRGTAPERGGWERMKGEERGRRDSAGERRWKQQSAAGVCKGAYAEVAASIHRHAGGRKGAERVVKAKKSIGLEGTGGEESRGRGKTDEGSSRGRAGWSKQCGKMRRGRERERGLANEAFLNTWLGCTLNSQERSCL